MITKYDEYIKENWNPLNDADTYLSNIKDRGDVILDENDSKFYYHGSRVLFDKFDDTKLGNNFKKATSTKIGFFFTIYKSHAKLYSTKCVYKVKLVGKFAKMTDKELYDCTSFFDAEDIILMKEILINGGYTGIKFGKDIYVPFNTDQITIIDILKIKY